MEKTLTLIVQTPPFGQGNRAYDALRLAGACLADAMEVRVHLLDVGVEVARKDHPIPEGSPNLEAMLTEFIDCGLEVRACGKSLDETGLEAEQMVPGVERGSMGSLTTWLGDSDLALTF